MPPKQKYLTKGVQANIPLELQLFMWGCVDAMPELKDYLQVFKLCKEDGKQIITHTSELPEYYKEYLFSSKNPIIAKVYIIEEGDYITMLLAEEY
ncbi:MAG: DUF960 domain-containing protein [Clostridia bacterium]|nr:DUF960 domain-containing protein [Clostridia bacterium]